MFAGSVWTCVVGLCVATFYAVGVVFVGCLLG